MTFNVRTIKVLIYELDYEMQLWNAFCAKICL